MRADQADWRVLADFAAEAVWFRLIRPQHVVAWADELIAATDVPPPWMMDLSLVDTADVLAMRTALRAVPGVADQDESIRLLNALVLREFRGGRLSIGDVRGVGWNLYSREAERRVVTQWGVIVESDGEYLDIMARIDEATMRQTIERELAPFEPLIDRLPWWA